MCEYLNVCIQEFQNVCIHTFRLICIRECMHSGMEEQMNTNLNELQTMNDQEKRFREILGGIGLEDEEVQPQQTKPIRKKQSKAAKEKTSSQPGERTTISLPTHLWAKLYSLSFHLSMKPGGSKVSMVDLIENMLEYYVDNVCSDARAFIEKYSNN